MPSGTGKPTASNNAESAATVSHFRDFLHLLQLEFDRYDRNGDGVLDAEELAARAGAKEQGALDGREMDRNRVGVLDEGEFIAAGGTEGV